MFRGTDPGHCVVSHDAQLVLSACWEVQKDGLKESFLPALGFGINGSGLELNRALIWLQIKSFFSFFSGLSDGTRKPVFAPQQDLEGKNRSQVNRASRKCPGITKLILVEW